MIGSLATVITNLISAIPWIGGDLVEFIWGGFSVNNATLNRFFSLHFVLPFILSALVVIHLITLHEHGSSNPLGVTGNADRLPMAPYFLFKDLVTIFLFFLVLAIFVMYAPNIMGHSDNYIPANPIQTPPSISGYIGNICITFPVLKIFNVRSFSASVYWKPEHQEQSGFIRVGDQFVKVNLAELKSLLDKAKTTGIGIDNDKFRSLVNGFFQAEGCWNGTFDDIKSPLARW
jgi:hypothetical protein